jgi:hypothetical protein
LRAAGGGRPRHRPLLPESGSALVWRCKMRLGLGILLAGWEDIRR